MNSGCRALLWGGAWLALVSCRGDRERANAERADSANADSSAAVRPDRGRVADVCTARAAAPPSTTAATTSAAWRVRELVRPARFRAFGWGAGDTLWGIARGRLAAATTGGDSVAPGPDAWSVQTAPGAHVVSWINETGVWIRGADGAPVQLTAARPPAPEHTGPEVLWSPRGERALLTWTAEAGPALTVLERGQHRLLRARLSGYMAGAPTLWLSETVAVLPVIAHGARQGASQHREGGYRGDLALLDIAADTIWRITDVPDAEFVTAEGLLAPDTLLIGVRTRDGWPERHSALAARGGTPTLRLDQPGRAAAHDGCIALLRPLPATTHEPEWALLITGHTAPDSARARLRGYDMRLLWHPSARRLAVAQESEAPGGYRTFLIEFD